MFITKKHLPRRTFLKGLGVTMALPLLDAMIPARTALAQTAAAPKLRAGFIYFPHGAVMSQWTPEKTGTDLEFTPILKPLEAVQEANDDHQRTGEQGGDRASGPCAESGHLAERSRSAQEPGSLGRQDDRSDDCGQDRPGHALSRRSKSASKRAAAAVRAIASTAAAIPARFPSGRRARRFRWKPIRASSSSACSVQGDTPEERKRIAKQYSSVLDLVSKEAADLQRSLGASDKVVLSDYLETVREIERRVEKMEARDLSKLNLPPAPAGPPAKSGRAPESDVRPDRAGLSGQPDARLQPDDGRRSQRPDLPGRRRLRCLPSDFALRCGQEQSRTSASRFRPTTARSWRSS